jgi:hypothetical protein
MDDRKSKPKRSKLQQKTTPIYERFNKIKKIYGLSYYFFSKS